MRLSGNRHPLARPENDLGRDEPDTRMDRMILLLQPDPTQEEALESFLEAQHNPESPYYHQWLTPEDFGRRFGVSEADLAASVSWLESWGFAVEPLPESRRLLLLSGTAAQVESAFATEIHVYQAGSKLYHANALDPAIPAALAPVVAGIVSLHNFPAQPLHLISQPDFTTGSGHYLAAADFATIYNLSPLYASSTDGAGQSIAVPGRSNINLADVQAFRNRMGLPNNAPKVIVNGPDPGVVAGGEQGEATLDVEWAGAVARNAAVQFVVSASTNSSDGVTLSSQYIVNHNLAPVISLSFGSCEAALGAAGNQFWNSLWQQAAAQGISVLVAAGDSGAAGCDDPYVTTAVGGHAVNGLCSSPYSTCVGGTQFADTANPSLYWQATNNPVTYASAVSYVPETAWNESATAGGSGSWAGGGGPSGIYLKPSWQMAPGVPAGNSRWVPDVALTSAAHDGYVVAMNGQLYVFSGTSAAAPAFAGLVALVNQRLGARVGNANPGLYALASRQASGGSAVFHDVTSGSNSVGGVTGYTAGPGYDGATGLGSVDANLLVNAWASGSVPASSPVTQRTVCSFTVKPGAVAPAAGGFSGSLTVTAGTGCAWTATSSASWITVKSAASGAGSGTVALAIAANPNPGARTGVLTVAGYTVTIAEGAHSAVQVSRPNLAAIQ